MVWEIKTFYSKKYTSHYLTSANNGHAVRGVVDVGMLRLVRLLMA